MRTSEFGRNAILTCVLAGFLSACGNKTDNPSPGAAPAAAQSYPVPGILGGRIVIAHIQRSWKTFNPITANEGFLD